MRVPPRRYRGEGPASGPEPIPNRKPSTDLVEFDLQLELIDRLDREFKGRYQVPGVEGHRAVLEQARRIIRTDKVKAFDLEAEPMAARDAELSPDERGHATERHGDAGDAMREGVRVLPEGMNLRIDQTDVLQPDDVHAVGDVGDPKVFVFEEHSLVVLLRILLEGHEQPHLVRDRLFRRLLVRGTPGAGSAHDQDGGGREQKKLSRVHIASSDRSNAPLRRQNISGQSVAGSFPVVGFVADSGPWQSSVRAGGTARPGRTPIRRCTSRTGGS